MTELPKNPDPSSLIFKKEVHDSDISTIYVVEYHGSRYALKVFHTSSDPGDPDFPDPIDDPDAHRFLNEEKAYKALHKSGACASGFVPKYYGSIHDLNPTDHKPWLDHFQEDKLHPRGILLEFLENAQPMDHVNYTKERISKALESLDWVHKALILHNDLCPRNILVVPGDPERVLVIDFDFAEVLPTKEAFDKPVQNAVGEWKDMKLGEWEDKILRDFGKILEEEGQRRASA